MTFDEFRKAIAPLAMLKKEVKDLPTWQIYHRALIAEPAPSSAILKRGLVRAARRAFFPGPGELREDCETERQILFKLHPYQGCDECHGTSWRDVIDARKVKCVERCACFEQYRQKMAKFGAGEAPLVQPQLVEADPENYRA